MVGAVYCPQYTEKQLGTTKVDKGEIYLTVTAKHATIADMQPNSIRDLKGVCVGNPSYCRVLIKISSPANTVAAKAAGLSGNLLLNCSKPGLEGGGGGVDTLRPLCLLAPGHAWWAQLLQRHCLGKPSKKLISCSENAKPKCLV